MISFKTLISRQKTGLPLLLNFIQLHRITVFLHSTYFWSVPTNPALNDVVTCIRSLGLQFIPNPATLIISTLKTLMVYCMSNSQLYSLFKYSYVQFAFIKSEYLMLSKTTLFPLVCSRQQCFQIISIRGSLKLGC